VIAKPRVYFAVSFLAAGVLIAPLVRTDSGSTDWQAMALAYQEPIFIDGFEDGTTSNWTVTVNGTKVTLVFPQGSAAAEEILLSLDGFGRAWVPTAILVDQGFNGRGLNAGPNTLVEDCTVRIDETGVVVIAFSLPPVF